MFKDTSYQHCLRVQLTAVQEQFSVDGLIKSTAGPITPMFFLSTNERTKEQIHTHTHTRICYPCEDHLLTNAHTHEYKHAHAHTHTEAIN